MRFALTSHVVEAGTSSSSRHYRHLFCDGKGPFQDFRTKFVPRSNFRTLLHTDRRNSEVFHDIYAKTGNLVTKEIRKSKKVVIDKLTEKLENPNTGPKGWWKTLKQFIKPDQTNFIPPLNKDGLIYSDEIDKANILNNYFTEQTLLDDSQASLPQTMTTPLLII